MSESEIINKLKERIRIDRSMRLNVESDFDRFCEEECRAIEGLIDLYQKEKEKNAKLKNADLTTVYMNGFYDGEKKWKDKIKEKTRYYQELYKQDNSPNEFLISQDCLSKLSFAQELLEERN